MLKTAIVTGGAKGIGRSIVETLASLNYNVVFTYNTSKEYAFELKSNLINNGLVVECFKADITSRTEVKSLISYTLNKFGNVDILVNNAGISEYKVFQAITDDDWNNMLSTNLTSAFYTIQEVLPNMIQNKCGCIINISSIWGMVGASCEVHYSVAKAGLDGLTKSLAKELGPCNIRVNSIAPGCIMTDMNKNLSNEDVNCLKSEIPLSKLGRPIDVARCVKWLVEDEYTTGQIISPNGGWVIV